jgi:hypothetical protein
VGLLNPDAFMKRRFSFLTIVFIAAVCGSQCTRHTMDGVWVSTETVAGHPRVVLTLNGRQSTLRTEGMQHVDSGDVLGLQDVRSSRDTSAFTLNLPHNAGRMQFELIDQARSAS